MVQTDQPNGFLPLNNPYGHAPSTNRYYKSATAGIIGIGDPVIRATNSTDPLGGPEIVRATTGAAITGVVTAIEQAQDGTPADLSKLHLASADTGYVTICDDPDARFVVQDTTGGTALVTADIGEHFDSITAVDADTTTGKSKYELDNAARATGNTWRLESLLQREGNISGEEHAKWIVSANLHTEANASATRKTEI